MHLGRRVGDPVLDRLLLGQHRAVGEAAERALAHHVEGPLGLAQPAHAVVDSPGAEARLGEEEAGALGADEVVGGNAHVVVRDLGVIAEAAVGRRPGRPSSPRRARSSRPASSTGTTNIDEPW